jgi:hypothetical protein
MGLIICPLVILIAVLKILEPMDYPVGDVRNSIEWRLVFYGAFIAVAALGSSPRRAGSRPIDGGPRERDHRLSDGHRDRLVDGARLIGTASQTSHRPRPANRPSHVAAAIPALARRERERQPAGDALADSAS